MPRVQLNRNAVAWLHHPAHVLHQLHHRTHGSKVCCAQKPSRTDFKEEDLVPEQSRAVREGHESDPELRRNQCQSPFECRENAKVTHKA